MNKASLRPFEWDQAIGTQGLKRTQQDSLFQLIQAFFYTVSLHCNNEEVLMKIKVVRG
jgi:hypothetical protein